MTELGLTADEVTGVKRTWRLVEADLDLHGAGILKLLFNKYPEYKKMFKFKEVASDKLGKNELFCKHSKTFMKSFQELVKNLENKQALIDKLRANADRHHARKITTTHYKNTLALLPGYLKEQLGPQLDDVAASGWGKVLEAIENVIGARLAELQKQSK